MVVVVIVYPSVDKGVAPKVSNFLVADPRVCCQEGALASEGAMIKMSSEWTVITAV